MQILNLVDKQTNVAEILIGGPIWTLFFFAFFVNFFSSSNLQLKVGNYQKKIPKCLYLKTVT